MVNARKTQREARTQPAHRQPSSPAGQSLLRAKGAPVQTDLLEPSGPPGSGPPLPSPAAPAMAPALS